MFTGIVQEVARVASRRPLETGARFSITSAVCEAGVVPGESIALDGACMTVVETAGGAFDVEVSEESLARTTLGDRQAGDRINLERSMRAGDAIGGHFVSGHIDGVGRVASVETRGDSWIYRFELDASLGRLLVEKGSVAVDGISLTCFACAPTGFDVAVIGHTARNTTLGGKGPGDRVNIENDLLGKYVAKLVDAAIEARLS